MRGPEGADYHSSPIIRAELVDLFGHHAVQLCVRENSRVPEAARWRLMVRAETPAADATACVVTMPARRSGATSEISMPSDDERRGDEESATERRDDNHDG